MRNKLNFKELTNTIRSFRGQHDQDRGVRMDNTMTMEVRMSDVGACVCVCRVHHTAPEKKISAEFIIPHPLEAGCRQNGCHLRLSRSVATFAAQIPNT